MVCSPRAVIERMVEDIADAFRPALFYTGPAAREMLRQAIIEDYFYKRCALTSRECSRLVAGDSALKKDYPAVSALLASWDE